MTGSRSGPERTDVDAADDRVAEALANERARVAAELRDGVVQELTGLSLSLASLVRGAGGASGIPVSAIADADRQLQTQLRTLRLLLLTLGDDPSESMTFARTVDRLARRVAAIWSLAVTVDVPPDLVVEEPLADLVRRMLAFARKQPLMPRVIDVNELIVDVHHLPIALPLHRSAHRATIGQRVGSVDNQVEQHLLHHRTQPLRLPMDHAAVPLGLRLARRHAISQILARRKNHG